MDEDALLQQALAMSMEVCLPADPLLPPHGSRRCLQAA